MRWQKIGHAQFHSGTHWVRLEVDMVNCKPLKWSAARRDPERYVSLGDQFESEAEAKAACEADAIDTPAP